MPNLPGIMVSVLQTLGADPFRKRHSLCLALFIRESGAACWELLSLRPRGVWQEVDKPRDAIRNSSLLRINGRPPYSLLR